MQANTKRHLFNNIGFILMVSLIVLRYPNFVFKPRFWAEEAVYFEIFYSLDHWWQSFNLLIYPAYYLFLSRLGPSLATVFPIEYAPLVTSFVGLIVLSIPLLIIFYTDSIYWNTIKSKLLISSLYIFSSTTGEVWMTSTNVGFIVPVFIFLILIDENLISKTKRFFYNTLLFIGAISSPIAMLMAPFFYIKYFISREVTSRNYCIILFFAALIQMAHYLTASHFGMVAEDRLDIGSWDITTSLGNLLAYNIIFPLFGYFISLLFREFFALFAIGLDLEGVLESINASSALSPNILFLIEFLSKIAFPVLCILLLTVIYVVFLLMSRATLNKKIFVISLFIYLSLVLNGLSLGALGGFRYSLITAFILLFYLHSMLIDYPDNKNYIAKILLSCSLIVGVLEYYPRLHNYVPDTFVAEEIQWPNWNDELKIWQENNTYLPKVWPYIKNKDSIYPARLKNEANIFCIDLNHPKNWERMGFRYFSSSFNEMLSVGISNDINKQIVHYDNCRGNIIINGEQESLRQ